MAETLGELFARALAAKDFREVSELLHPEVDLKGLTPGRSWDASGPTAVDEVLQQWFEPTDEIKQLLDVRTGTVGDREHVAYRVAVTNPDGDFEVEQQMYYDQDGERITLMRILCSGYQPAGLPS